MARKLIAILRTTKWEVDNAEENYSEDEVQDDDSEEGDNDGSGGMNNNKTESSSDLGYLGVTRRAVEQFSK